MLSPASSPGHRWLEKRLLQVPIVSPSAGSSAAASHDRFSLSCCLVLPNPYYIRGQVHEARKDARNYTMRVDSELLPSRPTTRVRRCSQLIVELVLPWRGKFTCFSYEHHNNNFHWIHLPEVAGSNNISIQSPSGALRLCDTEQKQVLRINLLLWIRR